MAPSLRCVIVTDYDFAIPMLRRVVEQRGHHVDAVVIPGIQGEGGGIHPGLLEIGRHVPKGASLVAVSSKKRLADLMRSLPMDLLLCLSFPWIIPGEVLSSVKVAALNGHPSFLPKYRGNDPVRWALRHGDPQIGFTVHRMVPELDAGPIMAQAGFDFGEEESLSLIRQRLPPLAESLYVQAVIAAEEGHAGRVQEPLPPGTPVDFEPGFETVDWEAPAREIHRKIRALAFDSAPAPATEGGSRATIDGRAYRVLRSSLVVSLPVSNGRAGEVLARTEDGFVVQCGDGPLRVWELTEL